MTRAASSQDQFQQESWMPSWADPEWFLTPGDERRFDEFLNLQPDYRTRVAQWVESETQPLRKRAVRSNDRERYEFAVGAIVANAIVATGNGLHRVYYSRDQALYRGQTPYAPDTLRSKMLIRTITDMEEKGLLWSTRGRRAKAQANRMRSTYRLTKRLTDALFRMGISEQVSYRDNASAPVVLLRDKEGKNLPYKAEEVQEEIANLRAYNDFICQQQIGLAVSAPPKCDLTKLRLYRVYNQDFSNGGRFYGGWYQAQPKQVRTQTLINSKPTVELDYASLLPRALYHEEGLDYRDDPYDVPEIRAAFEREGHNWQDVRHVAKRMFIVLVNAKGLRGLHRSKPMLLAAKIIRPKDAIAAIRKHHAQIDHRFLSSYGLQMMKKDSDICAEILSAGRNANIPVLPIHDSYVVQGEQESWLRAQMSSAYMRAFGFNPIIN